MKVLHRSGLSHTRCMVFPYRFKRILTYLPRMYYWWKLYWKLTGWSFRGPFPYDEPKLILAVGPHTSWHDFFVGLAARSLLRAGPMHFLGKKELFQGPFGWIFRALGGTPVDRQSSKGMVEQVADIFRQKEKYILALAPEGTRKKVEKLRSGFYQIAKTANVPILLVGFDFKTRQVCFSPVIRPTEEEKDMQTILHFFAGIQGKHPEKGMGHLLKA